MREMRSREMRSREMRSSMIDERMGREGLAERRGEDRRVRDHPQSSQCSLSLSFSIFHALTCSHTYRHTVQYERT
jgi:hypothetical protein